MIRTPFNPLIKYIFYARQQGGDPRMRTKTYPVAHLGPLRRFEVVGKKVFGLSRHNFLQFWPRRRRLISQSLQPLPEPAQAAPVSKTIRKKFLGIDCLGKLGDYLIENPSVPPDAARGKEGTFVPFLIQEEPNSLDRQLLPPTAPLSPPLAFSAELKRTFT